MMDWDYIVIGAGSAGCALAHQLVRGTNKRVLLLEAGGSNRSPVIKFPAGVLRACETYDWGYESEPDPSRNGMSEKWRRGRVLGGSSSINGMVFVRGTAMDFDRWAQRPEPGSNEHISWASEDVLPVFRDMEHSDRAGPTRGRGGPLRVSTVQHPHPVTSAFVEAAMHAGYPFNPDYNGEAQEGVGYMQRSIYKGLRCSAADAFIAPIRSQPNFKLLLDAQVERILIEQGHATGVAYRKGGKRYEISAHEIILCAGAINSPQLLLLSGVGDPVELEALGILCRVPLRGVGRGLQEQPMVKLMFRSTIPTYNMAGGLAHKLGIVSKYLFHREGPISSAFEGAGFVRSSPDEPEPDLQLQTFPLGFHDTESGDYEMADFPAYTMHIINSYPLSRGRISLRSADPSAPPLIQCRLLDEQADVDRLVRGIGVARAIVSRSPLKDMTTEEVGASADARDVDQLEAYVRDNSHITFHPVGTCRMGSDEQAVVDSALRVRGVANLRVADASIMPHHLSANINAACMMIGARLGRHLATLGA